MAGSSPRPTLPSLLLSPSCLHCSHPAGRRPFLHRRRPRGRAASRPPCPLALPKVAMEAREPRAQTLAAPSGTMTPTSLDPAASRSGTVGAPPPCLPPRPLRRLPRLRTQVAPRPTRHSDLEVHIDGAHHVFVQIPSRIASLDSADPKIDIQSRDLRLGFIFLRQDIHAPLQNFTFPDYEDRTFQIIRLPDLWCLYLLLTGQVFFLLASIDQEFHATSSIPCATSLSAPLQALNIMAHLKLIMTSWLPPPAPSKQQPGSMRALFRGHHLTLDRASWLKALENLPGMTLELPS